MTKTKLKKIAETLAEAWPIPNIKVSKKDVEAFEKEMKKAKSPVIRVILRHEMKCR